MGLLFVKGVNEIFSFSWKIIPEVRLQWQDNSLLHAFNTATRVFLSGDYQTSFAFIFRALSSSFTNTIMKRSFISR